MVVSSSQKVIVDTAVEGEANTYRSPVRTLPTSGTDPARLEADDNLSE
jgi:hypothetical protein